MFWVFAALVVLSALLSITRRNGVSAALWAAVAFLGIAGSFVLMQAYFLAVVEVLVYAGAIMVLFLFVIMLLNLSEEDVAKLAEGPRLHVAGALFGAAFLAALVWACRSAGLFDKPLQPATAGETSQVAVPLFQHYVLPFEIASFLLLAAIVGAVLITKEAHVTVGHMVVLAGALFTIGMLGVLSRRNILIVLLSVEIMLNAAALAFVAFSGLHGNLDGQVMVFFAITVAAAEVAVGLAVVIALFRLRVTVDTDRVDALKG